MARELVTRQGGAIGVRSRHQGGSIFWIELPLTPKSLLNGTLQVETPGACDGANGVDHHEDAAFQLVSPLGMN